VATASAAKMAAGGMFFNFVADDGRAVARWNLFKRRGGLDVRLEPFGRLPGRPAIEREIADIARFLETDVALT
jgi:hypothetical protein